MKKQILFAAASAALLLASCDKEGTNTQTFTTQSLNYITEVSPTGAPSGEVSIEAGIYKFGLDYNNSTVSMSAENLPSKVGVTSFSTQALAASQNSLMNITVDTKSTLMSEVSVDNLTMAYSAYQVPQEYSDIPGIANQTIPYGGLYVVTRYTIGGNYLVRTIWPDMLFSGTTNTSFNGTTFENKGIGYRVILNSKDKKATLVIYDAQFAPQMQKMNLVLENLAVDFQPNGIVISGTNVIAKYAEGGQLQENPNFPFDDIRFVIHGTNLTEATVDFSVAGRFYGSFTGSYILLTVPGTDK